ncbi:hypothetical protein H6G06_01405 [Anabaena sphaerica FACHB-251]|uniref:Uncharacterized protein n=1 Tax=Anabaena sphaerica FACHB-251 TaxID=2692883 RepID=A0A926WE05_9NOST|nr:hypothetical protein [Anabaena sphaerica]MBD2292169.1 hypothetical protein [Anabaena sphaerica FACHB-251]
MRSRYPQGNRERDCAHKAVMLPYFRLVLRRRADSEMPKPRETALRLVSGKLLL